MLDNKNNKSNKHLKEILTLLIELGNNEKKYLKIYKNSIPEHLAYNFCLENNLDYNSLQKLSSEIRNALNEAKNQEKLNNSFEINNKKSLNNNSTQIKVSNSLKNIHSNANIKEKKDSYSNCDLTKQKYNFKDISKTLKRPIIYQFKIIIKDEDNSKKQQLKIKNIKNNEDNLYYIGNKKEIKNYNEKKERVKTSYLSPTESSRSKIKKMENKESIKNKRTKTYNNNNIKIINIINNNNIINSVNHSGKNNISSNNEKNEAKKNKELNFGVKLYEKCIKLKEISMEKTKNKIDKEKKEEEEQYTFKPKINPVNIKSIKYNKKNNFHINTETEKKKENKENKEKINEEEKEKEKEKEKENKKENKKEEKNKTEKSDKNKISKSLNNKEKKQKIEKDTKLKANNKIIIKKDSINKVQKEQKIQNDNKEINNKKKIVNQNNIQKEKNIKNSEINKDKENNDKKYIDNKKKSKEKKEKEIKLEKNKSEIKNINSKTKKLSKSKNREEKNNDKDNIIIYKNITIPKEEKLLSSSKNKNKAKIRPASEKPKKSKEKIMNIYEKLYNQRNKINNLENEIYNKDELFKPKTNSNYKGLYNNKAFSQRQKIYKAKSTEKKKKLDQQIYPKFDLKTGQKLFQPVINKNYNSSRTSQNLNVYLNSRSGKMKREELQKKLFNMEKKLNEFRANNKSDNLFENQIIKSFKKIFLILDKNQNGKLSQFNYNTKDLPDNIKSIIRPILNKIDLQDIILDEKNFIYECRKLYKNLNYYDKKEIYSFIPNNNKNKIYSVSCYNLDNNYEKSNINSYYCITNSDKNTNEINISNSIHRIKSVTSSNTKEKISRSTNYDINSYYINNNNLDLNGKFSNYKTFTTFYGNSFETKKRQYFDNLIIQRLEEEILDLKK